MTEIQDLSESKGVFLSYKREDEEIIKKFYHDLKLRGVASLWIDLEGIRLGEKWKEEIERAIRRSSHLVVFVSGLALLSKEVKYEYEFAERLDKKIIPLILDETKISALPDLLREYQIGLNLHTNSYEKTLLKLARELPRSFILPELCLVSSGKFVMGPPEHEIEIELPDFWIGKTAVTVAEYACFVKSGGYELEHYWLAGTLEKWRQDLNRKYWPGQHIEDYALEFPLQPMRGVSWYEAFAYCQWLSHVTNHPFSLPTEAQWEKAARGVDARKWPTGDHWQADTADVKVAPVPNLDPKNVGIKGSDSPYRCLDMMGQVWNWTMSIDFPWPYVNDGTSEAIAALDEPRIIRGGSWMRGPDKARTYHRESQYPVPEDYRTEIGFRLVTNTKLLDTSLE